MGFQITQRPLGERMEVGEETLAHPLVALQPAVLEQFVLCGPVAPVHSHQLVRVHHEPLY